MSLSPEAKSRLLSQIKVEEELPIERIPAIIGGQKPEDVSILYRASKVVELNEQGLTQAKTVIDKMGTILKRYRELTQTGRALAANQIGEDTAIVVFLHPDGRLLSYINPEVTWRSEEENLYWEVCLSGFPLGVDVQRAEKVKVHWYDTNGQEFEEVLDGFDARRMQHEIDHLHGKVCYNTDGTRPETLGYASDPEAYMHQELRPTE